MKIIKNMVDFIRSAIVALISCLLTLFSPIQDILVGMVVLLTLNGVCGLFADIINGNGWEMNKATKFLVQCFVYFVLVMALFVVGHFIHKHDEAITCVSIISIIGYFPSIFCVIVGIAVRKKVVCTSYLTSSIIL